MSKTLDEIVDVIRDCLMGIDFEDTTSEVAAREILASLETEGYAVVPVEPTREMIGAGTFWSGKWDYVWEDMVKARPRHGISHPQAPYTPEPRKEES